MGKHRGISARGCLRESLAENGRMESWILMDGAGGQVWDEERRNSQWHRRSNGWATGSWIL